EHTYHTNLGPSPETPKPFLGAAKDGEGGPREISVKADKKGLIIGLTCLLRQILYRAKRSSTIEVSLHLTSLHSQPSQAPPQSLATEVNIEQAPEAHPDDSFITSWKCVFDVSLLPPPLPLSSSSQSMRDNQLESNPPKELMSKPSSLALDTNRCTLISAQLRPSATLARLRMSSNLTSELPLCPEDSLSQKLSLRNFWA
ncbi:hypothetical protein VP01_7401g1, partial [Puccinia sorghi]